MKTIIIRAPNDVQLTNAAVPEPGADDLLVRVRASGICGSDVHRYLGTCAGRKLHPKAERRVSTSSPFG